MPNLHDIERRIKSVESTKQITHTMQMVAAAKIRHSTERVEAATPYGEAVKEMLANIARMGGTTAPLATAHDEVKKTLIVVIASDRGLAGGFNSSVLRRAEQIMKERKAEGKGGRCCRMWQEGDRLLQVSMVSIRCLPSATCPLILASKRLMPWLTMLWSITSLAKLTR